jgi:trehalose utilization protein
MALDPLTEAHIDRLVRAARSHGLDGRDLGRLREFIWWQCLHSDAVDHSVIERVAERLMSGRDRPAAGQHVD